MSKITTHRSILIFIITFSCLQSCCAGFGDFLKSKPKVNLVEQQLQAALNEAESNDGVVWLSYFAGGESDFISTETFSHWCEYMRVIPVTFTCNVENEYLIDKYNFENAVNFILLKPDGGEINKIPQYKKPEHALVKANSVLLAYNNSKYENLINEYVSPVELPLYQKFEETLRLAKENNERVWIYYYNKDEDIGDFNDPNVEKWASKAGIRQFDAVINESSDFLRRKYGAKYTINSFLLDSDGNLLMQNNVYPSYSSVVGLELVILSESGETTPLSVGDVDERNPNWMVGLSEVKKIAENLNRSLLINIGRSTSCAWCVEMKKQVYMTGRFREYADEKLVLLNCDMPHPNDLPFGLRIHNYAMFQHFGAKYDFDLGVPFLIMLGSNGEYLGHTSGQTFVDKEDPTTLLIQWIESTISK